jgi:hypothetical protein
MGLVYLFPNSDGTNYWCEYEKCPIISLYKFEDYNEYQPIVFVDHSTNCKYTQKALNVQTRGGRLMLLAYDSNEIDDDYNVDDIIGERVEIPTVIINKDFAQAIKDFIYNNRDEGITLAIKFSGVKNKGEVNVDLYYRSDDIRTLNFFKEFESFKDLIKDKFYFIPRLKYNKFVNEHTSNELSANSNAPCVKDYHYCTTSNYNINVNNPRVILMENLRQSCIYETFGLDSYWTYMVRFTEQCADIEKLNFNEKCAIDVIKYLKFNEEELEECLKNLVEGEGKIEDDFEQFKKRKIFSVPEIIINGMRYKGSFSAKQIFNTICHSYLEDGECSTIMNIWRNKGNFGKRLILTMTLIIIVLLICTLLCYRRMVQKNLEITINEKIQEQAMKAISQYKAFQEGKGGESGVLGTPHKLELVGD